MVLYDHFHSPYVWLSSGFGADTVMVMVLSGFTSALQLRQKPPLVKDLHLASLPVIDWQKFLETRAVGIFPVLWLAILLAAPRWALTDQGGPTYLIERRQLTPIATSDGAECTVLYLMAMQLWDVKTCKTIGWYICLCKI